MKILNINKLYYPFLGGIEKITQEISEDLNNQADFKIDVLSCQTKGRQTIEEINGVKVYRAASFGKSLGMPLSLDFFKLFFNIQKDYDALLIHHPFPLAFLLLPFIKNKKVFIWYHSDIVRQKIIRNLFSPFLHFGLKKAKKILVSGQEIINNSPILKKYENKCIVVPFGVDLEYFCQNENINNQSLKIRAGFKTPLILSVGRLVSYKGFKYLITAMKEINGHLLIIGEGKEEKSLKKLIKNLGLTEKINIINHVSDLRPFYKACDIFVLPSCQKNEAFGLVQIEAMAYGKAIINTDIKSAVKEVSLNNVSGYTVKAKSAQALVEAIDKIIINRELQNRFGQAARIRVEKIFNKKIFIQKLTEALKLN